MYAKKIKKGGMCSRLLCPKQYGCVSKLVIDHLSSCIAYDLLLTKKGVVSVEAVCHSYCMHVVNNF